MLEMYLFINPLGGVCYQAEKNILQLMQDATEDVRFRFIPLLNMQSTQDVMKLKKLPVNDLAARNQLVSEIYRASLDFKAALFQGKKRGRAYLLNVQQQMNDRTSPYDDEVALKAAKESGLDEEMFLHDRQSDFAAHSFMQDQKMAAEMNVAHHPTVVLFNVSGFDCGIAMDACDSYDVLTDIFAGRSPQDLVEQTCGQKTILNRARTPLKIKFNSNN